MAPEVIVDAWTKNMGKIFEEDITIVILEILASYISIYSYDLNANTLFKFIFKMVPILKAIIWISDT